jgi:hypothetical protein
MISIGLVLAQLISYLSNGSNTYLSWIGTMYGDLLENRDRFLNQ